MTSAPRSAQSRPAHATASWANSTIRTPASGPSAPVTSTPPVAVPSLSRSAAGPAPDRTPQVPSPRTSSSCSPSPGACRRGPARGADEAERRPGVGHLPAVVVVERRREAPRDEVLVGQHLLGGVDDPAGHAPLLQPDEQLVGGQRLRQVLDGGPAGAEDLGVQRVVGQVEHRDVLDVVAELQHADLVEAVGQTQLLDPGAQRHELPARAGRHAGVQPAAVGALAPASVRWGATWRAGRSGVAPSGGRRARCRRRTRW